MCNSFKMMSSNVAKWCHHIATSQQRGEIVFHVVIFWTCHLLCTRTRCYHSVSKIRLTEGIFKLTVIHASMIYQIRWTRWIHGISLRFRENCNEGTLCWVTDWNAVITLKEKWNSFFLWISCGSEGNIMMIDDQSFIALFFSLNNPARPALRGQPSTGWAPLHATDFSELMRLKIENV